MIKIIKNIVIILVIINLLSSTIGVNIYMHHCNHSNVTSVSLFEAVCDSGGSCHIDYNTNTHHCDNCGVVEPVKDCCIDLFERKAVEIETVSNSIKVLKSFFKSDFIKIAVNIDDVISKSKLKLFTKLPRDFISISQHILLKQSLKISYSSDDDLIS